MLHLTSIMLTSGVVPLMTPSALQVLMTAHHQKVMLHLMSMVLSEEIHWCCWWCHQWYMMPTQVTMGWHGQKSHVALHGITWCQWYHLMKNSCFTSFWLSWLIKCSGSIDNVIGITCCWWWWQWQHMTKTSCCISFAHFDVTNEVGLLMTLLASCGSDTSINGITWPRKVCYTLFELFILINAMVLLAMPLASHDADASTNSVKWLK